MQPNSTALPPDPTGEIAQFVSTTQFKDLPASTVQHLKRLLLDGIANAVAGLNTPASTIQHDLLTESSPDHSSRILGSNDPASLLTATYLNAASANALDFDDTYKTFLHPGATAIAPALAIGEKLHAHGRDILTAVAVGYEVPIRLAEASFPSPQRLSQVWGFAPWQTLGAASAAAHLLGLDIESTRHAIGAAAFNAPLPSLRKEGLEPEDRPLSWIKNNYGWAAMGGVLGALMAERGMRSSRTVLNGERGFWVMAGSDRFDAELLTAGLGTEYRLDLTQLKPYAACRWTHSALDGLRQLGAQAALPHHENIDHIDVYTFGELARNFTHVTPEDIVDAQFSLPYLLGLELLGRSPSRGLHETDLRAPDVRDMATRITVKHDPTMDEPFHSGRIPARLVCHPRQGNPVEVALANTHWGTAEDPFTDADLLAKTSALLERSWSSASARTLIDGIMHLEEVSDISAILPHPHPDTGQPPHSRSS